MYTHTLILTHIHAYVHRYYVPSGMVISASDVDVPTSAWTRRGKDATAHVFRRSHWASWMFDVAEAAAAAGSDVGGGDALGGGGAVAATTTNSTNSTILFGAGGFQGCRGGPGSDWFVENVLELLDSPMEHYVDTATTPPTLYFQPNSTSDPPDKASLEFDVPVLQTLVGE